MREMEIDRGERVVRVRDAGDPDGAVVMYFHGTPGSRLDLRFGEELAAEVGVRLVSFDRPGYGGSTPAPFGLASTGADAHAVADALGVARFATLGVSGGGPGALAAAAVPGGGRVTRVGIASGAGPYQLVPRALEELDDDDRAVLRLLPDDPAAAAAAFAAELEPLAELTREPGSSWVLSAFEDVLSSRDRELLDDQRYAADFADAVREGLRPGTSGGGWDTVSWAGEWDFGLGAVRCPVLLWYGSEDFARPEGEWLTEHLPRAHLVVHDGEGHIGIFEHLDEMLHALTEPDTEEAASTGRP
jgi:pimeloyl-ACP methyl ester carboxylesterase